MPTVSQIRTDTFIEHRWNDVSSDILRGGESVSSALSRKRSFVEQPVLIGYMPVSKLLQKQRRSPRVLIRDKLASYGAAKAR
jgi:hypothetical protein